MPQRQYPQVFCSFDGKIEINGKYRKYWIQDATEDMFSEIMENLTERFIGDEPTTKYLKCKDDPTSMKEFQQFWIKMLHEKYSIACMTKDDQNNVKLAGFNVLTESKDGEKNDYNITGVSISRLFKVLDYVEQQRDFHKEFHLPTCMKAMGLYVLPDYRGDGLGEKLLHARELLCRAVGITGTITAFSSIISQKCAAKAGFKDFVVESYERLGEIDPDMKIYDIEKHSKYIKLMYKLYN